MTNSFYGGPNGKDFFISEIFTNRTLMEKELQNGWVSPISVGDFVMVSYRKDNKTEQDFINNRAPDLEKWKKSFDATIWQKAYDETKKVSPNGLWYKPIASMTGITPKIYVDVGDPLKANEPPQVTVDNHLREEVTLTFRLPVSQQLSLDYDGRTLDCDDPPEAFLDETNINFPVLHLALPQSQVIEETNVEWADVGTKPTVRLNIDSPNNINRPVLEFNLPQAQDLQKGTTTVLNADDPPTFEIVKTDVNNPVLNFSLPQSQVIQDRVEVEELNANQDPTANFDITTNVNRPVLHLGLPQSQVMANPSTTIEGPTINPSVAINNSNINAPKLEFTLPRAVKFYYGDLLGERSASSYSITDVAFADYAIGDYYINASTGFIYQITNKTDNTCEFTYVACIQSPLPETSAIGVNPFKENEDGSFTLADPTITRSLTNDEGTAWKLEFGLPQSPTPEAGYESVEPGELGGVSVSPSAVDKIKFNFKIPRGTRMFAGTEVQGEDSRDVLNVVVDGAKSGDLYLNTKTGAVYKLDKSGVWKFQNDGLKGPPGDALNVVRDYRIEAADNFNTGLDYIKANYIDSSGAALPYSPDELFAVTFVDTVNEREVSYWYFYTEDGKWGRAQLTGGVSNLIKNVYTESTEASPITNKTYSIDYINKLIGGNITVENADKTTFSKDQFYALLSWGTFEDATNNTWFPELSEDYDTLSASEIISLMSWGNMTSLTN